MRIVTIVILFAILGANATAQQASTQQSPAPGTPLPLLLSKISERLSLHFTIECDSLHGWSALETHDLLGGDDIQSADALIAFLNKQLPSADVFENPNDKSIIHVVERSLRTDDYFLDRRMTMEFDGTMRALIHEIESRSEGRLSSPSVGMASGGAHLFDTSVPASVDAKDQTYRSLISDFLPVKGRAPVLWIARMVNNTQTHQTTLQLTLGGRATTPIHRVSLADLLNESARKFSTYFTVEEDWRPNTPWDSLRRSVEDSSVFHSSNELLAYVRRNYPHARVVPDAANPQIVHLIDGSLAAADDPLDQPISFDFTGNFATVMTRVQELTGGHVIRFMGTTPGGNPFDRTVKANVHANAQALRSVLSDSLELEKCQPVLWVGRFLPIAGQNYMMVRLSAPPPTPATTQSTTP